MHGKDITDRLRWCGCCDSHEGADEIDRLREQVEIEQRNIEHLQTDRNNLALEIDRLRAERDEARRKWCIQSIQAQTGNSAPVEVLAKKLAEDILGWDCFKKDSND